MSAEAKPTAAPPPVFARRHPKLQYLAPGQHLKIASRKPVVANVQPTAAVPRDPWETQDDAEEGNNHNSHPFHAEDQNDDALPLSKAASSGPPSRSVANAGIGGGVRSPHGRSSTGGHPFSVRLSRSRSSVNSESVPAPEGCGDGTHKENKSASLKPASAMPAGASDVVEAAHNNANRNDAAAAAAEEEEDNYYHHTTVEGPELTPAERAQRVLAMQQQALEVKQLKALTEQGIARRPKTLVRNRHGRLQAIAASSPATSGEATLRIADAPATMRAEPLPGGGARAAGGAKGKAPAVTAAMDDVDLVNSRPSTPR